MTFQIVTEPAVRQNLWLRMAIIGPSGAGKTLGALKIATNLMGGSLPVIGVDTERERMLIYAPKNGAPPDGDQTFRFAHNPLVGDYSPETFIGVIDAVEQAAPGGVLIIDSFSHEWMGTGGVLQLADRFGQWKDVRPRHTRLVDRLMVANLHVICCIRAKMKYEVSEEERQGQSGTRQVITKLGIGPVQDDAIIYEFDVVADVDARSHEATFSNRCGPLVDTVRMLDASVASILTEWLSEGEPPTPPPAAAEEDVAELRASLQQEGFNAGVIDERFAVARTQNRGQLHPDYVAEQLKKSRERLAAKKPSAAAPAPELVETEQALPLIPDGYPDDAWTVAQLDAFAEREQVADYPKGGSKKEKLEKLDTLLAPGAADGSAEDIPFGDDAPAEQGALV